MCPDTSRLNKTSTIFIVALLYFFVFLSEPANSAEEATPIVLSIAFSDGDPPTSWSNDHHNALGLLPELAEAVFKRISDIKLESKPFPWPRAKLMAEQGQVDALLTYPSESRQAYLLFTDEPTYLIDYGYIIFSRDNPSANQLASINDYRQLADFMLVTEGPENIDSWEDQNLEREIYPRTYVNKAVQMFHLVFRRQSGDYFIRNVEEAKYIAHDLGYDDKFAYKKVTFDTQNILPFHLGVQRSHPQAKRIIEKINAVQSSPDFQKEAREIIRRYQ